MTTESQRQGQRSHGNGRITIADVARAAGVSPSAVSFALNDRPGIADTTRARILRIADELGWQPSTRARALARSRADAIGLVLARPPELLGGDPFFGAFLAGVEAVLSPNDHALMLQVITGGEAEELAAYRKLARSGRVDGVILTDARHDDPRFPVLQDLRLVAVVAGDPATPTPFPAVGPDELIGTTAAMGHLLDGGHRRIAYVSGPDVFEHARRRCAAWRSALADAGVHEHLLVVGDFTGDGGATATRELMAHHDPPTAIVYGNDLMAMGGTTALRDLGLRVPDDVSVVGYDDVPQAKLAAPALTTVRQDVMANGRAVAARLLSDITDKTVEVPAVPAPQLIVRGSTAHLP